VTSSPLILGFDMPPPAAIMALVSNRRAISINQQFLAGGAGGAGDFVKRLEPAAAPAAAAGPAAEAAAAEAGAAEAAAAAAAEVAYPAHPFPSVEPCADGDAAQQWVVGGAFNGSVCEKGGAENGLCFNIQMCANDLILVGKSSHGKGKGCGNNME
jgi:hypothetical protein